MGKLSDYLKHGRSITYINGNYYDISDYIDKHPGGEIIKSIANGNDGTAMFYSSHFKLPNIDDIPEIKKIDDIDDLLICPLKFDYKKDGFYYQLKSDIKSYFIENKIDYTVPTNFARICLAFNIILFFIFWYQSYIKGYLIYSVFMGVLSWNFAGTLVHDHGAHRTTVKKNNKYGNIIMSFFTSFTFPLAFETHFVHSHSSHHTMIHDKEFDSDENLLYPLVRLNDDLPMLWYHRYQYIYWPFAFSVYLGSYIAQTFNSKKYNWWRRHNHLYRPTTSIKFYLLLLSFFFFHIFIPSYMNGLITGLLSYFIFLFTYSVGGLFFALVTHYINDTEIIKKDNVTWDYNTIAYSGDFFVGDTFINYITGGFNIHGLHHLFPTIHPSHLNSVYNLYEKRCIEFNYPINHVKTWSDLVYKWHNKLYMLGNKNKVY